MEYIRVEGGVCAPKDFFANGLYSQIKQDANKKEDLALIYTPHKAAATGVYTKNKVKGASVSLTKKHLKNMSARCIICNSKNANTCNADGEEKAIAICELVAKELDIKVSDVILAQTGVIGQTLPLKPFTDNIPALVAGLGCDKGELAAKAIMTTDTRKKEIAIKFNLDGKECHIGGIAKGSGMINPNMATMLSFLTTDIRIDPKLLKKALSQATEEYYNMICVDGDTSTNDMVCIMANGAADNTLICQEDNLYEEFCNALNYVCGYLAKEIARDGEGATKLIICKVCGAPTKKGAKEIAKSIIKSSLVKCAFFGNDANWGRILCAMGYAKTDVTLDSVDVSMRNEKNIVTVCRDSAGVPFDEELALEILKGDTVVVDVNLKQGDYTATAFGCDLTYDYVKINGDYRT